MLEYIDESLEGFLRAAVPLSATDVDVSFEPPERTWSAKLNRPTVNLFLWDIRRSTDRSRTGVEQYERDGTAMRRMALPRVELRYLITAWTSRHADERALVGALLQAVLSVSHLPADYVSEPLRDLSPIAVLLSRSDAMKMDVFKNLEGQLKAALDVTLVTDVDTGLGKPLAPPVSEIGVDMFDRSTPGPPVASGRRVAGEVHRPFGPGTRVVGPRGSAPLDPYGRFLVRADSGDTLTVLTDPPVDVVVPDVGGVVVR